MSVRPDSLPNNRIVTVETNLIRLPASLVMCVMIISPAQACSIYCEPDPVGDFERAHYVFLGRVVNVKQVGRIPNRGYLVEVYFDIKKTWKGNLGGRPFRTINYDADHCGGDIFQKGEIRLLFLDHRKKIASCYPYRFRHEKQAAEIAAEFDRKILDWSAQ